MIFVRVYECNLLILWRGFVRFNVKRQLSMPLSPHIKQKTWHKFYLVRIWLEWCVICVGNAVLSTNSQYPDCETADELNRTKRSEKDKFRTQCMSVCECDKDRTIDRRLQLKAHQPFVFPFHLHSLVLTAPSLLSQSRSLSLAFATFRCALFTSDSSFLLFTPYLSRIHRFDFEPECVRFSKLPYCRSQYGRFSQI